MIAAVLLCLAPVALDGDTVRCSTGEIVHLFGIDAPEPRQPGYGASVMSLQSLIRGGLNCIHQDDQPKIDAVCVNATGEDVGEQQVRRKMVRVR